MNKYIPVVFIVLLISSSLVLIDITMKESNHVSEQQENEPPLPETTLSFPELHISTSGGVDNDNKETKTPCDILIRDIDKIDNYSGIIKGRGNTSWQDPKKPYNLILSEKADLFNMGESKNWCLISNYCDLSLCRNYFAFKIAEMIGCKYTPDCTFVNLYIDGNYNGLYLLTEKVETGKNRVEIGNTGFLVELDGYAPSEGIEDKDWFAIDGFNYAVKAGNKDNTGAVSTELTEGIKNKMNDAWDKLHGGSWTEVSNTIDVDTFACTFFVNQLFHNEDLNWSSFYFFKEDDGKLSSGPIWDFDRSASNLLFFYQEENIPAENHYPIQSFNPNTSWAHLGIWYSLLLQYEEFRSIISEKVLQYESSIRTMLTEETKTLLKYKTNFDRNFEKWNIEEIRIYADNTIYPTNWYNELLYVVNWLETSLQYTVIAYHEGFSGTFYR